MNDSDSQDSLGIRLRHLGWAVAGIVILWVLSGVIIYNWAPGGNYGTFGDMFGAINSLFSGFAFACLIFATLLQREELKLQRRELQLARQEAAATREEIRGQKEQAVAQNATLAQQTFENMFFQILRQHGELISALSTKDDNSQRINGRICFAQFHSIVSRHFERETKNANNLLIEQVLSAVRSLDRPLEDNLGHYFRSLSSVLAYLDQSIVGNKLVYARILRDSLTPHEVALIFYRCIETARYGEFRALVEKFGLLKNLDESYLLTRIPLRDRLSPGAYA